MQTHYSTTRLALSKLQLSDTEFIRKLVNTEGWIKFIGQRNVYSDDEAAAYMNKLTTSNNINYWVVTDKESNIQTGVVTLIKRDYLPHYDIGFAFLPEYSKKGFACEAASALINDVTKNSLFATLLATTLKENTASINLLQKLGFVFDREIERDSEQLLVYRFESKK